MANLKSGGYQTAVFNMLFLVSTHIAKSLAGEIMDEELFRRYFVKLYRKIVQMEVGFRKLLEDKHKDEFLLFSESMHELARSFKVYRDPK